MKNISLNDFGKIKLFFFFFTSFLLFSSCHSYTTTSSTLRLHDIWGLKELDKETIDPLQGAVLELYVEEQRFLLSINQQSYQGRFRASDTKIQFSKVKAPQRSSPSVFEESLTTTLSDVDRWAFQKNYLLLYKGEALKAKFIKMD